MELAQERERTAALTIGVSKPYITMPGGERDEASDGETEPRPGTGYSDHHAELTRMTEPMKRHFDLPDEAWTDIARSADLMARLAAGDGDALAGSLVHAEDDLDALVARADHIHARGPSPHIIVWRTDRVPPPSLRLDRRDPP